jgi:hypothetical protein
MTKDRILVQAKINGVEGLFVLDTGAQNIVVSGAFARRAGLEAMGHGQIGGPAIDEKVDTGIASTIAIGDAVLSNAMVYFGTKKLDDEGPDGLLGFDVFAGALVSLDVENSTLQIADPDGVDPLSLSGIHVRTDLGDGTPNVPMRLEPRIEIYAVLDTGNPAGILIPYDLPQREGRHLGMGEDCGTLDTLTLGSISFMTPTACLSGAMTGHAVDRGLQFLPRLRESVFRLFGGDARVRGAGEAARSYPLATMDCKNLGESASHDRR